MLILLIILALIYAFLNGYRDSSSILAGVIASRAMQPRLALYLVGLAEFIAPFLFGVAVARTVATGVVVPSAITLNTLVVAMIAALTWTLIAWWQGIPSSSSHALIGGLLGAALVVGGVEAIQIGGLYKVILPLFLAPPLGMVVGYLAMLFFLGIFGNTSPRINTLFRRLQILTMVALALSHSSNDSQKSMGIIALGVFLSGNTSVVHVSSGIVAACALAIALGASRGDWRLIRTLGGKIYRIRPVNALASQTASAGVVLSAALLGAPVSTSQVISMALMGAGAAERVNKVRWQVGRDMLVTWGLTIPATIAIAAATYWGATEAYKLRWVVAAIVTWLSSG
jgi:inorganic phosphate transporter, PiT family